MNLSQARRYLGINKSVIVLGQVGEPLTLPLGDERSTYSDRLYTDGVVEYASVGPDGSVHIHPWSPRLGHTDIRVTITNASIALIQSWPGAGAGSGQVPMRFYFWPDARPEDADLFLFNVSLSAQIRLRERRGTATWEHYSDQWTLIVRDGDREFGVPERL